MKIRFSDGYSKALEYDNIFTPALLKKAAAKAMQETGSERYFLQVDCDGEWYAVKCSENGKDYELYLAQGAFANPYEAFNDCQRTLAQEESLKAMLGNLKGDVKRDIAKYVSLAEYAKAHGITEDAVKKRAQRGAYKTARKIGRNWVIDATEPHIDSRIKSGKYKNWRKTITPGE